MNGEKIVVVLEDKKVWRNIIETVINGVAQELGISLSILFYENLLDFKKGVEGQGENIAIATIDGNFPLEKAKKAEFLGDQAIDHLKNDVGVATEKIIFISSSQGEVGVQEFSKENLDLEKLTEKVTEILSA